MSGTAVKATWGRRRKLFTPIHLKEQRPIENSNTRPTSGVTSSLMADLRWNSWLNITLITQSTTFVLLGLPHHVVQPDRDMEFVMPLIRFCISNTANVHEIEFGAHIQLHLYYKFAPRHRQSGSTMHFPPFWVAWKSASPQRLLHLFTNWPKRGTASFMEGNMLTGALFPIVLHCSAQFWEFSEFFTAMPMIVHCIEVNWFESKRSIMAAARASRILVLLLEWAK